MRHNPPPINHKFIKKTVGMVGKKHGRPIENLKKKKKEKVGTILLHVEQAQT